MTEIFLSLSKIIKCIYTCTRLDLDFGSVWMFDDMPKIAKYCKTEMIILVTDKGKRTCILIRVPIPI